MNGQAEVANQEIITGLKTKLDHTGGSWVDELPSILWAYRTTPWEAIDITSFHLVYGAEAVVPVEEGVESDRRRLYDDENVDRRLMELELIEEVRGKAALRLTVYRQCMKQKYDRQVAPNFFEPGDLVWKRIKPVGEVGKLQPQWGGPFWVIQKVLAGSYYLQDSNGKQLDQPWSANYFRSYLS